jgi:hypothetical protein
VRRSLGRHCEVVVVVVACWLVGLRLSLRQLREALGVVVVVVVVLSVKMQRGLWVFVSNVGS